MNVNDVQPRRIGIRVTFVRSGSTDGGRTRRAIRRKADDHRALDDELKLSFGHE